MFNVAYGTSTDPAKLLLTAHTGVHEGKKCKTLTEKGPEKNCSINKTWKIVASHFFPPFTDLKIFQAQRKQL